MNTLWPTQTIREWISFLNPSVSGELHAIRVNVDNFEEAMKIYNDEGFTVFKGPNILPDSKNVLLAAPDKPLILLMQHIKKG